MHKREEAMDQQPIKILHVSFSLLTGGLESIIVDLVRSGPAAGYTCAAAVLEGSGAPAQRIRELGCAVVRLGKRPGLDIKVVFRLAGLIRQMGSQVVHAHNEGAALYAALAGLLTRTPVICTRHGASFGLDTLWLRRVVGRLCKVTVCVSADVLNMAQERDRLPSQKLRLIYNGIDTSRFAPNAQARHKVRHDLDISEDQPVVISVGRLAPEKAYHDLLTAVAGLPVRLLLVGDGPERAALSQKARELGLDPSSIFLGERGDISELLNGADVFCLSSLSEGVSMALLEAMASGLPAVATHVGGNPEVVLPQETGLLTPSGDPQALAETLGKVLGQDQRAVAWGQAGRRRVQQNFSLQAMVQGYADLYQELSTSRITSKN